MFDFAISVDIKVFHAPPLEFSTKWIVYNYVLPN